MDVMGIANASLKEQILVVVRKLSLGERFVKQTEFQKISHDGVGFLDDEKPSQI